jgi:hypothetical protein
MLDNDRAHALYVHALPGDRPWRPSPLPPENFAEGTGPSKRRLEALRPQYILQENSHGFTET